MSVKHFMTKQRTVHIKEDIDTLVEQISIETGLSYSKTINMLLHSILEIGQKANIFNTDKD